MKKIIFLASVASIVLAGCTSIQEGPQLGDQEISFSSPVTAANTKGAVPGEMGTIYSTNESFNVFAVKTAEAFAEWNPGNIYMNGVTCTHRPGGSGVKGTFAPSPMYYWPKNGDKLTFAAYSPAALATEASYTKAGLQLTDFTIPANGCNSTQKSAGTAVDNTQFDVLFSDRTLDQESGKITANGPNYLGVDLTFHHALSSVQFKVSETAAYPDVQLYIKEISLHNIGSKASFNENISDTEQTKELTARTQKPEWTEPSPRVLSSFAALNLGTDKFLLTTDSKGMHDIDATRGYNLILLPQVLKNAGAEFDSSKDPYVKVVWVQKNNDTKEYETTTIKPLADVKFTADAGAEAEWKMGYRYTYNIAISLDEITFNPIVDPWKDATGGDITIN